jgi:hypothetical protein
MLRASSPDAQSTLLALRAGLMSSEDTALNHVMKAAKASFPISRSSANQQRLRELAFVYADIAEIQPSALRWGEVVIDRPIADVSFSWPGCSFRTVFRRQREGQARELRYSSR